MGKPTRLGKLFWINILFFSLAAASIFLSSLFNKQHSLEIVSSFLILTIALPLAGLNITAILERLIGSKLHFLERMSTTAITALLFMPFLLALEYTKLHIAFPTLPLLNATGSFLLAVWINPLAFENFFEKDFFKTKIFRSFVFAFFLYGISILIIALSYYPLPDFDPYYWLSKYSKDLPQGNLVSLDLYRPLFSSLAYIFNQTANVDLYAFFKYALPFLTLLVLLPGALVARLFSRSTEQLAILLLPLASASFILYFQIPIPQAILNITLAYFIFFLVYSWMTGKNLFYFLAGISIFVAYFYHEAAALILLPWLLVTLYHYRHNLWRQATSNKLSATLIAVLVLSYASPIISPISSFLLSWVRTSSRFLYPPHTNFAFPATYINIDGNTVGWGDWEGVIKYYLFYVGPAVFLACSWLLWSLRDPHFYLSFWNKQKKRKEFLVLIIAFFLFFSIAEILPRLFNIAFLPERAWGFTGLLLLAFVPLCFRHYKGTASWMASLFIIALLINIGGALYINALKKYLITPEQITSAEWIRGALPENRIIFTYGNANLLRIHSQSKTVEVEHPRLYSDIHVFDAHLSALTGNNEDLKQHYTGILKKIAGDLEGLQSKSIDNDTQEIITGLQSISQTALSVEDTLKTVSGQAKKSPPLYIYYAKTSSKNPYATRPYFKEDRNNSVSVFIFDHYPERFKRIYALPNDEVVIWQFIENQ